jgi:hypothetical protein
MTIRWPEGKRFAFTVVDDTDESTIANTKPVYDLLIDLGFRTTKTVWPLTPTRAPKYGGLTLEDDAYRAWILDLKRQGFEIALHGTTDHPSERHDVERGIDYFREVIGHDPRMHVNHDGQTEGMYWGDGRLDEPFRAVYRLANAIAGQQRRNFGHIPTSPYFWGDICRDRVEYVRNFVFNEINTLAQDPMMPYHDHRRPYVKYWYSGSNGAEIGPWLRLMSDANQDSLVADGGACIAYTHFALGFVENGKLNARFEAGMRRLADLGGWFVPASELLDYLREQPGWRAHASRGRLRRMQLRFLASRLRSGTA